MLEVLVFFIFIAFIGIVVGIWYWFEKKRTAAWEAAAEELGLVWLGKSQRPMSQFGGFKLFSRGHSRKSYNVMAGNSGDIDICICDYQYTTGGGKNSSTHYQTICVLKNNTLQIPHCYVRPQTFFDGLGKLFGGKDFDFDEDPDFSKAYVLQGENESAVRALFDRPTREWFVGQRAHNFHLEGHGKTLLFHRGKRIKPGQARELLEQAFSIQNLWATGEETARD